MTRPPSTCCTRRQSCSVPASCAQLAVACRSRQTLFPARWGLLEPSGDCNPCTIVQDGLVKAYKTRPDPALVSAGAEVCSKICNMASTQQVQLPQTAQVREMEEYINNSDFQQLMHSLMTEVFTKKPENTIDFMLQWLEKEKERRVDEKLALQH